MKYNHTQTNFLLLYLIPTITMIFWTILIFSGIDLKTYILQFWIILILSIFIIISFSTLNVLVNEEHLQIKFSYGIFKKSFLLNNIVSIKIVRNHWYYGWWIRVWFNPYMWIYNIYWLDAIELIMKNGRIYRIGTDDVANLKKAILELKE